MAMNLPGILLVEFAVLRSSVMTSRSFTGRFAGIDDHVGFEVQHALQLTQRDVEQVADAAGQALEEPHVRARAGQLDVAQAFAANLATA